MPEFHARQPAQDAWKAEVMSRRLELEELDTEGYNIFSHQNKDIVRLSPDELKARMAAKEAAGASGGDD